MKQIVLSLSVLSLALTPLAAHAAACRDAKGRFAACAQTASHPAALAHPAARAARAPHAVAAHPVAAVMAAKAAPRRCKIGGRFANCSAPGAKSV